MSWFMPRNEQGDRKDEAGKLFRYPSLSESLRSKYLGDVRAENSYQANHRLSGDLFDFRSPGGSEEVSSKRTVSQAMGHCLTWSTQFAHFQHHGLLLYLCLRATPLQFAYAMTRV